MSGLPADPRAADGAGGRRTGRIGRLPWDEGRGLGGETFSARSASRKHRPSPPGDPCQLPSAFRPTGAIGLETGAPVAEPTVPGRATTARPARVARSAAVARLSGRAFVVLAALAGLVAIYATDQVVPATSAHQAEMRVWLAARAAGFLTLGLLTLQVVLGLVLSHPTNKTTWKLSKLLFPWHENAWIFVTAFLVLHVVTIVADPYAGVGIGGALVPGLSRVPLGASCPGGRSPSMRSS